LKIIRFDVQDYLSSPEDQAAYIDAALETGDADFIAAAIGDVVRARGVLAMARDTGLTRPALYKAFSEGGNPTLETLTKVTNALGLRLTVKAA
jgi:probable addiction module antidote protein